MCERHFNMYHSMKRMTLSLACALLIALELFAQGTSDYRVLPDDFNADKEQQMMRAYQREQVHDALNARLDELEASLASPDAISAYQRKRR